MAGKQVYILGAGASHASSQAPLGNDLVWMYDVDTAGLENPPTQGPERYRRFLVLCEELFPGVRGLVSRYDNRIDRNGTHWLFSPTPTVINNGYYVDHLLRVLAEANRSDDIKLIKHLIAEHIMAATFGQQNDLFHNFLEQTVHKNSNVCIISFNFDFLLEQATWDFVRPDYFVEFAQVDDGQATYSQLELSVIKLHGSLNWALCGSCDNLRRLSPFIEHFYYRKARCACSGELEPFIIVPHEAHMPERIAPAWNEAAKSLREAETITVIGYSFPYYDTRVHKLLQDNSSTQARVVVVDHACASKPREYRGKYKELLSKYAKLLPGRCIDIRLDGFEGFLNACAQD